MPTSDLKCPRCRQPMIGGFVSTWANRGIHWRDKDQPRRWWRPIWKASLKNTLHWWQSRENPAWRCASCDLVVVDHSTSTLAGSA